MPIGWIPKVENEKSIRLVKLKFRSAANWKVDKIRAMISDKNNENQIGSARQHFSSTRTSSLPGANSNSFLVSNQSSCAFNQSSLERRASWIFKGSQAVNSKSKSFLKWGFKPSHRIRISRCWCNWIRTSSLGICWYPHLSSFSFFACYFFQVNPIITPMIFMFSPPRRVAHSLVACFSRKKSNFSPFHFTSHQHRRGRETLWTWHLTFVELINRARIWFLLPLRAPRASMEVFQFIA